MGMMVNSNDSDDDVIGTINTTPLVDIMLVLLIIFLNYSACCDSYRASRICLKKRMCLMKPNLKIFNSQSIKMAIFSGMKVTLPIKPPYWHDYKQRHKRDLSPMSTFVVTNLRHTMRLTKSLVPRSKRGLAKLPLSPHRPLHLNQRRIQAMGMNVRFQSR